MSIREGCLTVEGRVDGVEDDVADGEVSNDRRVKFKATAYFIKYRGLFVTWNIE